MRGDFSRDTFDPLRRFSRVLVQQGRLQIDADSNEQSDILLHYLRTLATDLIGGHGGPGTGFTIDKTAAGVKQDFAIQAGRYYVNGVLVENASANLTYATQGGYVKDDDELADGKRNLVYIDVWERHVTSLDDDAIHDVALGQADTTTRAQVMWQLRALSILPDKSELPAFDTTDWRKWIDDVGGPDQWLGQWPPQNRGFLKAMGRAADSADTTPCVISPESRFRGLENQLYRVEIHTGGALGTATFKWSRNNGSDVVGVKSLSGGVVTLASPGRGDRETFVPNDWVEIIEDGAALRGEPGPLAMVIATQPDDSTVTLKPVAGSTLPSFDAATCVAKHVQLRRWDYRATVPGSGSNKPKAASDGALVLEEDKWLALEDGVQVMFSGVPGSPFTYRAGDYWYVPARTATGDVDWPGPVGNPEPRPPRGVRHYYAPLAVVDVTGGEVVRVASLRNTLKPIGAP
jgi:hypothetical protein